MGFLLLFYILSCFVYFACLRFVFFFSQFLFLFNFFFSGFIFCFLFYFVILFDSFRLPFDFIECESELVCGFFVEFSGIFFVVFNLFETQHLLFVCFIFLIFIFGGLYFCFKFFLFLCFGLFYPRVVFCRFRFNSSYNFVLFFLFFLCFL